MLLRRKTPKTLPCVELGCMYEWLVLYWMVAVRSWTEQGEGKTIYSWPLGRYKRSKTSMSFADWSAGKLDYMI